MKKICLLMLLFCCLLPVSINADEINLSSNYPASITRSLIRPVQVFISYQIVEVDFISTLGTVVISIYDETGNIVYQQLVIAAAGQRLLIDISLFDEGNYTIEIDNSQTHLSGNFEK